MFQLYHDENVTFDDDDDDNDIRIILDQRNPFRPLLVLARWNNIPRVDNMSLLSDTSTWFRAIQFLLKLLNAACLVEKQQMLIL